MTKNIILNQSATSSTISLAGRTNKIKPSPTLAVVAQAAALQAVGHNIISLGAGEPDFDTPEHIKEAAYTAIQAGKTKYTPVDGAAGLKQAIIDKLRRDNLLQYFPEQILVSCGAKQSLYNAFQALLNPGDEVIIPAPYWVSYPDMTFLAEGTPVTITTTFEQHYKMTPEQLEQAITARTKILVLNSPSNPTGAEYSLKELEAFGEVLLRHPQIIIVSDDIYEYFRWSPTSFKNILNACPALYDRTIIVNGVSKAYAMTGWRIGYAAGPISIINAMKNIQSQSTSNPCSISQAAAEAAIKGDQSCVKDMVVAFKKRHDALYNALKKIPGVQCRPSDGTFYIFPDFSKIIDTFNNLKNDIDFAAFLLHKARVALVPGSAFGGSGAIRFSFCMDENLLQEAVQRICLAINDKGLA